MKFPIRRAVSLRVPTVVPPVIEPASRVPETTRPPTPVPVTIRRSASMPPIPEAALRRPNPVEVPSLTEELQLLAAEPGASDPTEYYDRPAKPPRRRALLISGCAAVLSIAIIAMILRGRAPTSTTVVDVAVTSIPAGASVTLIDEGGATVIGKTPATASIDKARGYDLVFALRGHQTTVYHLAPNAPAPLAVELPAAPR